MARFTCSSAAATPGTAGQLLAGDPSDLAAFGSAVAPGRRGRWWAHRDADNRGAVYAYTRTGGLCLRGQSWCRLPVPPSIVSVRPGASGTRFRPARRSAMSPGSLTQAAPSSLSAAAVAGRRKPSCAPPTRRSTRIWQRRRAEPRRVLLGAPNDDAGTCCDTGGAVYAFQASGAHWRQVDKQVPPAAPPTTRSAAQWRCRAAPASRARLAANVPSTNAGVAHTHPELLPLFKDGFD